MSESALKNPNGSFQLGLEPHEVWALAYAVECARRSVEGQSIGRRDINRAVHALERHGLRVEGGQDRTLPVHISMAEFRYRRISALLQAGLIDAAESDALHWHAEQEEFRYQAELERLMMAAQAAPIHIPKADPGVNDE